MKYAILIPVPESGDSLCKEKTNISAFFTVVSKMFERVMSKELNVFFQDKLSPLLGGYRKDFSCQYSLVRFVEKMAIVSR